MVNNGTVPGWPCKVTVEEVEVVPIDKRWLLTSKPNNASAARFPVVPANWILPTAPVEEAAPPLDADQVKLPLPSVLKKVPADCEAGQL